MKPEEMESLLGKLAPPEPPAGLEERIRDAARARLGASPVPRVRVRAAHARFWGALGLAASLMASLAVFWVVLSSGRRETSPAGQPKGQELAGVPADLAWIEKRVEEWQPTRAERRFDEIGWVRDIREAERLAKESGRPVFLFTHKGRMQTGRC